MTILFHKPYGVLSQFTPEGKWLSLADFALPPKVYPAGRLDADSEGLLLLTDDGIFAHRLTDPKFAHPRTYWAQVEGTPCQKTLSPIAQGICIQDYRTQPAFAEVLSPQPTIPERNPPIRFRALIPTTWISLTLTEGKNRQVRKMTAACGFPTLRLIRVQIGEWLLSDLPPGCWREIPTPPLPRCAAIAKRNRWKKSSPQSKKTASGHPKIQQTKPQTKL